MLHYAPILPQDYPVLTQIMTAAFDEDTRLHTSLLHDGPAGYNDGTLIRKLNENPDFISEKVLLDDKIIGAYTISHKPEQNILELLFLDPDCGNQGLGTQIWNHIEEHFSNCSRWVLETPSYSTRNHHFYTKKCGFHFVCEKQYPDATSFVFEKERKSVLDFQDMMKMQTELWEKHKDKWPPMQPEYGKDFILWMIEEIGEVISIIKKKSIHDIMDNPAVHSHFVEELSDLLMYYMDTLLRYQIAPEEISKAYQEKHDRNMGRNYAEEYQKLR